MAAIFQKIQFRHLFLLLWTILGIIQASSMELIDDEAYYWVYGEHIDWGHFHHPPMVALFSKMGYALFPNEFGVRFFFLIAHLLTLVFIEKLAYGNYLRTLQGDKLFAMLVSSLVIMHVAGFWAAPDIPYLLFSVLFLWLTKKYQEKDSAWVAIALTFVVAATMYSKYYGVVTIVAVILANLKLFKRPSFYLIGIGALILFLPHLYWLYESDFITFQFHLAERDRVGYKPHYPFLFLGGLALMTGPILGLLLLIPTLLYKPKNDFDKTLKFFYWGIILFFGFMSFRSRIEANWLVAVNIPILILGHRLLLERPTLRRWVWYSFPVSLAIAIFLRIILAVPILPPDNNLRLKLKEFHHNEAWAKAIEEKANGLPVVFNAAHQRPSKFLFYSNNPNSTTLTPVGAAATQFELYDFEKDFQGKKVMMVYVSSEFDADTLETAKGNVYYKFIDPFCSFGKVEIKADLDERTYSRAEKISIPIQLANYENLDFTCGNTSNAYISYFFFKKGKTIKYERTTITPQEVLATDNGYKLQVTLPEEKGDYAFNISIWADYLPPTHNSTRYKIKIE